MTGTARSANRYNKMLPLFFKRDFEIVVNVVSKLQSTNLGNDDISPAEFAVFQPEVEVCKAWWVR